MQLHICSR